MISMIKPLTVIKRSMMLIAFTYLTACSYSPDAMRQVYNGMATEFADELKDSVDFTAEQRTRIDDYARQVMQWHRHNKLPEYAQHLSTLASLVTQDALPVSSLKTILDQFDGAPHFEQASHLSHKLAAVAQTLSGSQVKQLAASLDNEHQQIALEIKSISNSREISEGIHHFFRFMGLPVGAVQQHIINTEALKFHDLRQQELDAEIRDDNKLLALLRNPQDAQFMSRFINHWNQSGSGLSGQVKQLEQANKTLTVNLIRKLILSMDQQQKAMLSEKLYSISQTLGSMANE